MPAKNTVKIFVENGYYHVYNRGVEKRNIFVDQEDYRVFLKFLNEYLSPSEPIDPETTNQIYYQRKQYSDIIQLHAFVLMPNHFHLLIHQTNADSMARFLQSLCTRYSMYFNRHHNRVGGLFQGRYKAVMVKTDEQLIHLSRYIHKNPKDLNLRLVELHQYPFSSYSNYTGESSTQWLHCAALLSIFSAENSNARKQYIDFVEYTESPQDQDILKTIVLE